MATTKTAARFPTNTVARARREARTQIKHLDYLVREGKYQRALDFAPYVEAAIMALVAKASEAR